MLVSLQGQLRFFIDSGKRAGHRATVFFSIAFMVFIPHIFLKILRPQVTSGQITRSSQVTQKNVCGALVI